MFVVPDSKTLGTYQLPISIREIFTKNQALNESPVSLRALVLYLIPVIFNLKYLQLELVSSFYIFISLSPQSQAS